MPRSGFGLEGEALKQLMNPFYSDTGEGISATM
jgi:hypothetical protein